MMCKMAEISLFKAMVLPSEVICMLLIWRSGYWPCSWGGHGTPYNVGSTQSVSMIELAETIVSFSRKKLTIRILNTSVSGNAPNVYMSRVNRYVEKFQLVSTFELMQNLNSTLGGII